MASPNAAFLSLWPEQEQACPDSSLSSFRLVQQANRRSVCDRCVPVSIPFDVSVLTISSFFPDAAKALCENTDNAVLSCWPVSSTSMNQNEFTQFVCKYIQLVQCAYICSSSTSRLNREQPTTFLCPIQRGRHCSATCRQWNDRRYLYENT